MKPYEMHKNARITSTTYNTHDGAIGWSVYTGPKNTTYYSGEDYNMEVFFTPKAKPFIPGYYRRTVEGMDSSKNVAYWYPTDPNLDGPGWERVNVTPE